MSLHIEAITMPQESEKYIEALVRLPSSRCGFESERVLDYDMYKEYYIGIYYTYIETIAILKEAFGLIKSRSDEEKMSRRSGVIRHCDGYVSVSQSKLRV